MEELDVTEAGRELKRAREAGKKLYWRWKVISAFNRSEQTKLPPLSNGHQCGAEIGNEFTTSVAKTYCNSLFNLTQESDSEVEH